MLEPLGNEETCTNRVCVGLCNFGGPATQYAVPITNELVWSLFEHAQGGRKPSVYSLGSDISLAIKPLALTTH